MGFPLYGNELDENTTPLEAGLDRFVKFDKPHFIGKDELEKQARQGINRRLVGLEMTEQGIPRSHHNIIANERIVGNITSGTMSPTLGRGIGMGYVETAFTPIGTELGVEIRGKIKGARVAKTPFYTKKTVRVAANYNP